jgi:carbon storage regulator
MLVLSRQTGDRIQIGDDIVLTVIKVTPHSVRIGVEAPASIAIVRSELVKTSEEPAPENKLPASKASGTEAG